MEKDMTYSTKAKQNWNEGEVVKVGFLSGLEVIKKVATPGDYRPDLYVLWQAATNRIYRFTPHHGIERCENVEEAMAW
jgi:hypothetical protein